MNVKKRMKSEDPYDDSIKYGLNPFFKKKGITSNFEINKDMRRTAGSFLCRKSLNIDIKNLVKL